MGSVSCSLSGLVTSLLQCWSGVRWCGLLLGARTQPWSVGLATLLGFPHLWLGFDSAVVPVHILAQLLGSSALNLGPFTPALGWSFVLSLVRCHWYVDLSRLFFLLAAGCHSMISFGFSWPYFGRSLSGMCCSLLQLSSLFLWTDGSLGWSWPIPGKGHFHCSGYRLLCGSCLVRLPGPIPLGGACGCGGFQPLWLDVCSADLVCAACSGFCARAIWVQRMPLLVLFGHPVWASLSVGLPAPLLFGI